ncbi:MAG: glycosyltransferase family 39 protein [Anaerolineales bacterium]|nr:glycosyltransferase family 39 protein [Anaerolineales bacterium]
MNTRRAFIALISLFWLAIIVSLYFVLHKPISPAVALSLARAGGQLLIAWGLISIAGGLGAWLVSGERYHPLTRLAVQAALGLGIMSLVVLFIGSTLGLNPLLMWSIFIGSGVLFRRYISAWWKDWRALSAIWQTASRIEQTIAFSVGLIMFATLIATLAPPLKYDALVYHLTLPQAYLDAGRIVYIPWLMLWGMPQITEMLYTWAMALAGTEAAVALGWMIGLLSIAGIWGFVSQKLNARSAWIGVAALMAGFTTTSSLAWGYIGWMTILCGLAFLVIMDRWVTGRNRKDLILAGIFVGIALGAKYTAGVLLLCGLVMTAWFGRKEQLRELLRDLFLFGIVVALVSSPWWVKNLIFTGNPFYPLIFPSGAMDQLRLSFFQDQPVWGGWREAVFLPLYATIRGVEGTPGFNASIGPLLLALGTFAWIGWLQRSDDQRNALRVAVIFSLSGLVIWALGSRFSGFLIQTRLYFSLFPAFVLLAGAGYNGLSRITIPRVRLGRVVAWFVLLVLGLNLLQVGNAVLRQNAHNYLFSNISKEEYLLNNLGWFAWVLESIEELPDNSRVLMLWEPRSYYCAPKCIPDEILDRWIRESRSHPDANQILDAWQAEGFTHLLFYREGAKFIQRENARYRDSDWQLLETLLGELPDPLEFGDIYELYPLTKP